MNIVVIGHVDSGKSTTTGHLIYKLVRFYNACVTVGAVHACRMPLLYSPWLSWRS